MVMSVKRDWYQTIKSRIENVSFHLFIDAQLLPTRFTAAEAALVCKARDTLEEAREAREVRDVEDVAVFY